MKRMAAVVYDLIMRLPLAALMLFSALQVGRSIAAQLMRPRTHWELGDVTGLASMIATLVFILLVAALTLLRSRPTRKLGGVVPRVTALAAGILPATIGFLPKSPPTPGREAAGTLLILAGAGIAVSSLTSLGRSFSVMPEARRLVTHGPYRLVRHPVYLGEAIQSFGTIVLFPSLVALGILLFQLTLQIVRIGYEERVLREQFPEYEDYARRIGSRLIPRVY